MPDNNADSHAMVMARVEKKDPVAINHLGSKYFHGMDGLQKDMRKAVELWTEAADLGSTEALFNLGNSYNLGEGVVMQGNVQSRHNLGCDEGEREDFDRAVRHFLISAKMGHKNSLESIKKVFMAGLATKEQYAEALKVTKEPWRK